MKTRKVKMDKFRGYTTDVNQINTNTLVNLTNAYIDDGKIYNYQGYRCLFPMDKRPNVNGKVTHISVFPDINESIIFFLKTSDTGGSLYKTLRYNTINYNAPQLVYTPNGVIDGEHASFFMRGYKYFLAGNEIFRFDGTNIEDIKDIAFIPTLVIGRAPDGTGNQTAFEEINVITYGFKNSFSSDGTSTLYYLNRKGLEDNEVSIKVGTSTLIEGTHFTVNRTNGTVNFAAGTTPHGAPIAGTDNVIITAYHNHGRNSNRIIGCKKAILYGTGNDSRVILYDNSFYPNMVFWSNVYDPTYWPENNYNEIGDESNPIKGITKQFDSLIILKETNTFDSTVWLMRQEFDSNGNAVFNFTQGISGVGMDVGGVMQTIEDKPVFLSRSGLYRITGTNVKDERILGHISHAIDEDLLSGVPDGLYSSFDFDGKLGVSLYDKIYIFDYKNQYVKENEICYECYKYDLPHDLHSFANIKNMLYIGCGNGMIYVQYTNKFENCKQEEYTNTPYVETQTNILSTIRFPWLDLGDTGKTKHIHKVNITLKCSPKLGSNGGFSLYAKYHKPTGITADILIATKTFEDDIQNFVINVNERDILKAQFMITGEKEFGMSDITIEYSLGRDYKGW